MNKNKVQRGRYLVFFVVSFFTLILGFLNLFIHINLITFNDDSLLNFLISIVISYLLFAIGDFMRENDYKNWDD